MSFITFEGIDGCGKSTQLKLVSQYLEREKIDFVATREPGGTRISEKIREILLSNESQEMSDRCELLLYLASRAQLVEEFIFPQLFQSKIVLCDRFYDSTIAYQVYGRSVCSLEEFLQANRLAIGNIEPDFTFIFDLPVEVAFSRMKDKKADRLEALGIDFFQKVRDGFLELAKHGARTIINANRSVEEVSEEVLSVIKALKSA
jgi:dTMP kinase